MLSKEQNELVTQTGPGTPMGDLFRCYWLPALLAEELPENDCAPVRVKSSPSASSPSATQTAAMDSSMNSAPIAAPHSGLAAMKNAVCAAPITAGNSTSPASASMCPLSQSNRAMRRRSS